MRDSLFSLRGIGSGEKYMVSMLLAQALFLGIFIGAFDISAHSLFLAIFDEKMLAKAYIASGFAGIILLSVYFFLQARMKFRNFGFLNLIAVTQLSTYSLDFTCKQSLKMDYFSCIHHARAAEYHFSYGFQDNCRSSVCTTQGKKIICYN